MKIKYLILSLLSIACVGASAQSGKKKPVAPKKATVENGITAKQKALFDEMLDNTQVLFVIDSTVVDTKDMLKAVSLPKDLGEIVLYKDLFNDNATDSTYVYLNGFKNKSYYALSDTLGNSKIYCRENLNNKWSAPQHITGIDENLRYINNPFMTSDGETFYFTAKSEEGLGGYDLYVTHYDSEKGTFLEAENVGLPMNSYYDDLLYVEDDCHGFAWLASTRNQPANKVCIYTIKTAKKRTNYDADELDEKKLNNLGKLSRIRDTWTTPEQRDAAMAELKKIVNAGSIAKEYSDNVFVVNDELVYNGEASFSTTEGKSLYKTLLKLQAQKNELTAELETLRTKYHSANKNEKNSLKARILKSEESYNSLLDNIHQTTARIRKIENNGK